MSTVSLVVDSRDLHAAIGKAIKFLDPDTAEMMTAIGALGESQTRRRITDEKTAPDGTPWKENWTETSILLATGQHLLSSIVNITSADEAEWGSTWELAHVHQDGAVIVPKSAKALVFSVGGNGQMIHAKKVTVPARQFVGLSSENEHEMVELVTDIWGSGLQ